MKKLLGIVGIVLLMAGIIYGAKNINVTDEQIVSAYCTYTNKTIIKYEGKDDIQGNKSYRYIAVDNNTGHVWSCETLVEFAKAGAEKQLNIEL